MSCAALAAMLYTRLGTKQIRPDASTPLLMPTPFGLFSGARKTKG
jgi:hypothetical protein